MAASENSSKQSPLVIILFVMGIGFGLFILFRLFGPKLPEPHTSQPAPTKSQEDLEQQRQDFVSSQEEKEEIMPVLSGSFASSENGSGDITIYKSEGNQFRLVLQDFSVSSGPDLHVIVLPFADVPDNETIGMTDYIDIGPLIRTEGDQHYSIPDSFDPTIHRSIAIWCVACEKAFLAGALE
jgi:hypothetical protein